MSKQTIGSVAMVAIAEGKNNAEVLAAVKAIFPEANTSSASINWYRNKMKKSGAPEAKKTPPVPPQKTASSAAIEKIMSKAPSVYTVGAFKATAGTEGSGFVVTLYRDGKAVARAADYADGGPVHWEWKDTHNAVTVKAVDYSDKPHEYRGTFEENLFWKHCLALPKYTNAWDKDGGEHYMTPDIYVEELLNDMELRRKYLRLNKNHVIYVKDGQVWTWKVGAIDASLRAEVAKKIKAQDPLAIVLSELSEDEAVATFKALVPQR